MKLSVKLIISVLAASIVSSCVSHDQYERDNEIFRNELDMKLQKNNNVASDLGSRFAELEARIVALEERNKSVEKQIQENNSQFNKKLGVIEYVQKARQDMSKFVSWSASNIEKEFLSNKTDNKDYNAAVDLLKDAKLEEAKIVLSGIEKDKRTSTATRLDALYLMGSIELYEQQNDKAASSFFRAYETLPQEHKGKLSLFKLGVSLANADNKKGACTAFGKFVTVSQYQVDSAKADVIKSEAKALKCKEDVLQSFVSPVLSKEDVMLHESRSTKTNSGRAESLSGKKPDSKQSLSRSKGSSSEKGKKKHEKQKHKAVESKKGTSSASASAKKPSPQQNPSTQNVTQVAAAPMPETSSEKQQPQQATTNQKK